MPVKEGGSAEGEDEDRMSCSADSRHGYPKMGGAACRGMQTVLEMHQEGCSHHLASSGQIFPSLDSARGTLSGKGPSSINSEFCSSHDFCYNGFRDYSLKA